MLRNKTPEIQGGGSHSLAVAPQGHALDALEGGSRSFADVPRDQAALIKAVSQFQGEPAVLFSEVDIARLASPFERFLVGKFSYGRPNLDTIRKAFLHIGFRSDLRIGVLDL